MLTPFRALVSDQGEDSSQHYSSSNIRYPEIIPYLLPSTGRKDCAPSYAMRKLAIVRSPQVLKTAGGNSLLYLSAPALEETGSVEPWTDVDRGPHRQIAWSEADRTPIVELRLGLAPNARLLTSSDKGLHLMHPIHRVLAAVSRGSAPTTSDPLATGSPALATDALRVRERPGLSPRLPC